MISCVDTKNGVINYSAARLKGMMGTHASPVAANGHIFIIDRKGTCVVIKEGSNFEVITQNKLDDIFDASPVILGNNLVLRGLKSSY